MEFKMNKIAIPESIGFNFEELKAEIATKASEYANTVYLEDQIKMAKADRAKLNKFVKTIEDKQKEVKKDYLKPYMNFEANVKELTGIVNVAIRNIDSQVKAFEEKKNEEKLEQIKELFKAAELPEYVSLEQLWNEKWLNKAYTLTKIRKEFETTKKDIIEALKMLSQLPEFGFEAVQVYKRTLNVANAVDEAQRMAKIQKMKAEAEVRRKEEAERKVAEELLKKKMEADAENIPGQVTFNNPEELERITEEAQAPVKKQWIAFEAYMSVEDAKALKAFFDSRSIEFKRA